jgi:CheY-like chemotaxis protein
MIAHPKKETTAAPRNPRHKDTTIRSPRILVAEDDSEMRRLLVWRLRNAGFETVECSDGFQLLDSLGKPVLSGEPDDFDLIVSDIRMPGVTGLEVLEGIHETEWFVPMILITAFGNDEVHQTAERFGAAAMFDKPFDIDVLIERIREILVLNPHQGDNWSPQPVAATAPHVMPVDVVFSHMQPSDYLVSCVKEAATILEPLKSDILYCRAVIVGPNGGISGRYYVQIMVTMVDKVFVVRSNLKAITNLPALIDAVPKAFEVTLGKIRKRLQSMRPGGSPS